MVLANITAALLFMPKAEKIGGNFRNTIYL